MKLIKHALYLIQYIDPCFESASYTGPARYLYAKKWYWDSTFCYIFQIPTSQTKVHFYKEDVVCRIKESDIPSIEQLFLKYYGIQEDKKHDLEHWKEILNSKKRK